MKKKAGEDNKEELQKTIDESERKLREEREKFNRLKIHLEELEKTTF